MCVAVCKSYLNMPYVFYDRQSVPKWMSWGNAVTTVIYEGARVHLWVAVNVCVHAQINRNTQVPCASAHVCVLLFGQQKLSICPGLPTLMIL